MNSRLVLTARQAVQVVLPLPEDRPAMTWQKYPYSVAFLVPFLLMAYLVRRDGTHLLRIAMFPVVVATAVHCIWGYDWDGPDAILTGMGEASCECPRVRGGLWMIDCGCCRCACADGYGEGTGFCHPAERPIEDRRGETASGRMVDNN